MDHIQVRMIKRAEKLHKKIFPCAHKGNLEDYAWFMNNSDCLNPVGQKIPNAYGLYDMHGNVWEMCTEEWLKGGGNCSSSEYCTADFRLPYSYVMKDTFGHTVGFRPIFKEM